MHITLNGDAHGSFPDTTVNELLPKRWAMPAARGRGTQRRDRSKSQHAQTALSDGDQIEIVVAVGGG